MKTFNKKGDQGETSLLYGGRVPKSDPHCEAYGTIDEAVAALGLARALSPKERVQEILLSLQKELFLVAAEMATPTGSYPRLAAKFGSVSDEMVERLEDLINELEAKVTMPKAFIIPGPPPASAALDLARAMVRRAERRAVALRQDNLLPNQRVLHYLNRLADLLFTVARYEEQF